MISATRKCYCVVGFIVLFVLVTSVFLSHKYYTNYSRFSSNITYYEKPLNFMEKYEDFDFDRANWTVYMKSQLRDEYSRSVLNELKTGNTYQRLLQ